MNENKYGNNSHNKIPINSKQVRKNFFYQNINNINNINKENSNKQKYTQNNKSIEKKVQRNKSSIGKKNENIKYSFNENIYNIKPGIRKKYKEKNLNNLSQNKITVNKSINDSKKKMSSNKNIINRDESLKKIIISSSKNHKTIKKLPSSLEKKVNSYLIPKIENIGLNAKTQINKINKNLNLNQNSNNIIGNKFIDISSKKKQQPNNIYDKYYIKYSQQKSKEFSFDNSNNNIYKGKKTQKITDTNNIFKKNKENKENKENKDIKNDELNSNVITIDKKIFNNSINYINNDDFQRRNKTVIGKKDVYSVINGPYLYNLNENKNDLNLKNTSIFNKGKLSFKNTTSNFIDNISKKEKEKEKDKINENIAKDKIDNKNNATDNQIIKKINNIIAQLKIEKKEEFYKQYNNINIGKNTSSNNDNVLDLFNKNQINKKENETDYNINNRKRLFKYEDFKINTKDNNKNDINDIEKIEKDNIDNYIKNKIIKNNENELKRKQKKQYEEEIEIENSKTKENNIMNGYNYLNKLNHIIIKYNNLNNGQENNNNINNDKIIMNSNNVNDNNPKNIGERDIQTIKKDEKDEKVERDGIPLINKNSNINIFNKRIQNNEIIKINVKNLKGVYQNKKDLNKVKEIDIDKDLNREKIPTPKLITQSLIGLVNLGETCYMNTGLQNIIHCIPFINQLFSVLNQFKDILEQKIITYSFLNLCVSLIKNDNNINNNMIINKFNINSFDPSNFRYVFCKCHKEYADNGQHDSLEFLRVLLDDISKELNQTKIISQYKELITEGKSKEVQNYEYNNFYLCRENSIIVKVFYSQIMNIFTCECGDISYSFEKILDIPLLFPKDINSKEINLNELLSHYFNGEKISWSLACQKCGQKNLERNKKIKLSILPEVIIFSLQRFNPITGVKINKIINFEELIDLKPFCDNDFFNGEINTKYRLFAISNHSGTINFGHYYSYTKVDENWYEFNDSFVKPINLNLMSRAAYFFFYEKSE